MKHVAKLGHMVSVKMLLVICAEVTSVLPNCCQVAINTCQIVSTSIPW